MKQLKADTQRRLLQKAQQQQQEAALKEKSRLASSEKAVLVLQQSKKNSVSALNLRAPRDRSKLDGLRRDFGDNQEWQQLEGRVMIPTFDEISRNRLRLPQIQSTGRISATGPVSRTGAVTSHLNPVASDSRLQAGSSLGTLATTGTFEATARQESHQAARASERRLGLPKRDSELLARTQRKLRTVVAWADANGEVKVSKSRVIKPKAYERIHQEKLLEFGTAALRDRPIGGSLESAENRQGILGSKEQVLTTDLNRMTFMDMQSRKDGRSKVEFQDQQMQQGLPQKHTLLRPGGRVKIPELSQRHFLKSYLQDTIPVREHETPGVTRTPHTPLEHKQVSALSQLADSDAKTRKTESYPASDPALNVNAARTPAGPAGSSGLASASRLHKDNRKVHQTIEDTNNQKTEQNSDISKVYRTLQAENVSNDAIGKIPRKMTQEQLLQKAREDIVDMDLNIGILDSLSREGSFKRSGSVLLDKTQLDKDSVLARAVDAVRRDEKKKFFEMNRGQSHSFQHKVAEGLLATQVTANLAGPTDRASRLGASASRASHGEQPGDPGQRDSSLRHSELSKSPLLRFDKTEQPSTHRLVKGGRRSKGRKTLNNSRNNSKPGSPAARKKKSSALLQDSIISKGRSSREANEKESRRKYSTLQNKYGTIGGAQTEVVTNLRIHTGKVMAKRAQGNPNASISARRNTVDGSGSVSIGASRILANDRSLFSLLEDDLRREPTPETYEMSQLTQATNKQGLDLLRRYEISQYYSNKLKESGLHGQNLEELALEIRKQRKEALEGKMNNEVHQMVDEDADEGAELLKKTNKQLRTLAAQMSRILCSSQDMHTELQIDKREQPAIPGQSLTSQSNRMVLTTVELCKNTRYDFKIPVKNEPAPLRFRFEYLDVSRSESGEVIKREQLLSLKGYLDVFLSKSTDNPDNVRDAIEDPTNHCEKLYTNMTPPTHTFLQSNFQNVPLVPFPGDYAYLSFTTKDLDRFDDMMLTIRVLPAPPQGKVASKKKKVDGDLGADDEDDLDDFYQSEKARDKKNNLIKFMEKTKRDVDILVWDEHERKHHRKIDKQIKFNRLFRPEHQKALQAAFALETDEVLAGRTFLTDAIFEKEDILNRSAVARSPGLDLTDDEEMSERETKRQEQLAIIKQQRRLQMVGDFIELNKLQIKGGQHDQVSRLRRQLQLSIANAQKQRVHDGAGQRELETYKRMLFLLHRRDILRQRREEARERQFERTVRTKRANLWYRLLRLRQVQVRQLAGKLLVIITMIRAKRRKQEQLERVRRALARRLACYGSNQKERYRHQISYSMRAMARVRYPVLYRRQLVILKDFFLQMMTIIGLSNKMRRYAAAAHTIIKAPQRGATLRKGTMLYMHLVLLSSKRRRIGQITKERQYVIMSATTQKAKAAAAQQDKLLNEELLNLASIRDETLQWLASAHYMRMMIRQKSIDYYALTNIYKHQCEQYLEKLGVTKEQADLDLTHVREGREPQQLLAGEIKRYGSFKSSYEFYRDKTPTVLATYGEKCKEIDFQPIPIFSDSHVAFNEKVANAKAEYAKELKKSRGKTKMKKPEFETSIEHQAELMGIGEFTVMKESQDWQRPDADLSLSQAEARRLVNFGAARQLEEENRKAAEEEAKEAELAATKEQEEDFFEQTRKRTLSKRKKDKN